MESRHRQELVLGSSWGTFQSGQRGSQAGDGGVVPVSLSTMSSRLAEFMGNVSACGGAHRVQDSEF